MLRLHFTRSIKHSQYIVWFGVKHNNCSLKGIIAALCSSYNRESNLSFCPLDFLPYAVLLKNDNCSCRHFLGQFWATLDNHLPFSIKNVKTTFICYLGRKVKFWSKFRNSGSMFWCQHKTLHTTRCTCKLPKSHWFFPIEMPSMYENCNSFTFHDITLIWILSAVFIFASNYYQTATFFIHGEHYNLEKQWLLGSWLVQQCCLPRVMLV